MITFKYNNRIYKVQHLKNKLKKLGITEADIEIIPVEEQPIEYVNNTFYYFINKDKQLYIKSIYPTSDTEGFIPCTKEELLKEFPNCKE